MRGTDVRGARSLWSRYPAAAGGVGQGGADGLSPAVSGDGWSALRAGFARLDGLVPASGVTFEGARPLSGGREYPSGTGIADGCNLGTARGGRLAPGPQIDAPVEPGGYRWWYFDALSSDGQHGLTMIALIGSVFSPYYAWSGRADPLDHCALNVALYGKSGGYWAMTERGRGAVHRYGSALAVGPSSVHFEADRIVVTIDETTAPFPRRFKGRVVLFPIIETSRCYSLDVNGSHHWWPIAPRCRVEVELSHPSLCWSGHGYVDANAGAAPLEADFKRWNWSYAALPGRAVIFYDAERRDGGRSPLALEIGRDGGVQEIGPLPEAPLKRTSIWRMPRSTKADASGEAAVLRTLEDTPFYSRSTIASRVLGEVTSGMHESLDLDRFSSPVVRGLLPFRNPRAIFTVAPRKAT